MIGLLLMLLIGAWMNRDSIRQTGLVRKYFDAVETAKGEAVQMRALYLWLAAHYPAEEILIRAYAPTESGKTVKTLVVVIVNPEFPVPESREGKAEKARKIAMALAADYPSLSRYEQLQLSFVKRNSGGASLRSPAEFQFPTAELLGKPSTPR